MYVKVFIITLQIVMNVPIININNKKITRNVAKTNLPVQNCLQSTCIERTLHKLQWCMSWILSWLPACCSNPHSVQNKCCSSKRSIWTRISSAIYCSNFPDITSCILQLQYNCTLPKNLRNRTHEAILTIMYVHFLNGRALRSVKRSIIIYINNADRKLN